MGTSIELIKVPGNPAEPLPTNRLRLCRARALTNRRGNPMPRKPSTPEQQWPDAEALKKMLGAEEVDEPVAEVMSTKDMSRAGVSDGAVAVATRAFSDSDLRNIESWDDALAAANEAFGAIPDASTEIGNGFSIAEEDDKRRLCGVPLLLLEWRFSVGEFGSFVIINAVQKLDNGSVQKWIITDGGTGIARQLSAYQGETGRTGGLGVPKGLRESRYMRDADSGETLTKAEEREYLTSNRKMVPGHTFYLDTSAA